MVDAYIDRVGAGMRDAREERSRTEGDLEVLVSIGICSSDQYQCLQGREIWVKNLQMLLLRLEAQ